MASVATTEEERAWLGVCHTFYATGDEMARRLIEAVEASDPGNDAVTFSTDGDAAGVARACAEAATRDRYLQLKDAARREAHAGHQARRAADFAARVDALSAPEPPTTWSAVRTARERLSTASARWRHAPSKARVLRGLASLLRAQRSAAGGRVLRWVADTSAVVEAGDNAFLDEFVGLVAALAARATLDSDELRVELDSAWSDRSLGRIFTAAPRPDKAAGSVEATDGSRTNADGGRDEAVPLAERLYVLVLDLYVWLCD